MVVGQEPERVARLNQINQIGTEHYNTVVIGIPIKNENDGDD
jgi:hypothetical protein